MLLIVNIQYLQRKAESFQSVEQLGYNLAIRTVHICPKTELLHGASKHTAMEELHDAYYGLMFYQTRMLVTLLLFGLCSVRLGLFVFPQCRWGAVFGDYSSSGTLI